jgi:hypothetical protein
MHFASFCLPAGHPERFVCRIEEVLRVVVTSWYITIWRIIVWAGEAKADEQSKARPTHSYITQLGALKVPTANSRQDTHSRRRYLVRTCPIPIHFR